MRYAETGYNLEIDLATGNIERVETDPKLTELHLGGLGYSVKLFWDRVPPETKAFDPENLLIFSSLLSALIVLLLRQFPLRRSYWHIR